MGADQGVNLHADSMMSNAKMMNTWKKVLYLAQGLLLLSIVWISGNKAD